LTPARLADFGARSMIEGLPGDGLLPGMSNLDKAGVARSVYRETVFCVPDPPHGWDGSHEQFGTTGMNDGFMREYQDSHGDDIPPYVMGYFQREDLPVSWALGDAYTLCDRWFSSVMGPTWPNRFYLHTAQSGGRMSNEIPPSILPTIYDRLNEAGIEWMYYYSDLPFIALLSQTQNLPIEFFYEDAKNGTLPPVTFLDPSFGLNDDHPPHHPLMGQQFISSIYQALATSPHWNNCLLVVTYDEHGGFFDHVPPPKVADDRAADGFDQLGFRVPTLIVGPWVKEGHVSSVVYDHTSILKHIETMFDLEPLTARDAAAADLSDAIDADRMAANEPKAPITLPAIELDASDIDDACRTIIGRSQKSDIEIYADEGKIPKDVDLRHLRSETALYIGDYLRKHGLGGIRRH